MSASPVREFLSFRRTFALLILLVVLPSAGLSAFGIVAIVNERAAVEKRLELVWLGKLDALAEQLTGALASARFEPGPGGLTVRGPEGRLLSTTGFRVEGERLVAGDATLQEVLLGVRAALSALPASPTVFTLATPQGTLVLATLREGRVLQGAQLDLDALEALAQELGEGLLSGEEEVNLQLRVVQRQTAEGLVNRLVSEVVQAREAVGNPRPPLAERTLPAPLQELQLAVVPSGEDPVALTATRNRAVYGVLLGLFYVTLVVGVVMTGRSLYREAQLSRLKTDFVSQVSHELKTPLTSIRMFIETLALGRVKEPAQTQQVLSLLLQETERLSGLIERVLDWGRIESGRRAYRPERSDVREVVGTAITAFRAQRLDAQVSLALELAEQLPQVDVDREALSAAVLNLLQNAYKYSGEDKRITVRARRDKRGVAIDVEDNGVGIAAHERRKVFERFYRVDNLLTRRTEGSGLGLSIARRIVEAHKGRMSVSSQPGRGSTFTIHLPAPRRSA